MIVRDMDCVPVHLWLIPSRWQGMCKYCFRLKLLIVLVANGAYLDVCKRAAALVASTGPWFSLCVA